MRKGFVILLISILLLSNVACAFTFGSNKSTDSTPSAQNKITRETAMKVALTAIINDRSLDVFTADGNYYDEKKFHDYKHFYTQAEVVDEGTWSYDETTNCWHVSSLLIYDFVNNGFAQYDFDIRFDGKYYYAENGWCVHAGRREWLDKSDPSKYGEDNLSNTDFYTYLKIKPSQVGE